MSAKRKAVRLAFFSLAFCMCHTVAFGAPCQPRAPQVPPSLHRCQQEIIQDLRANKEKYRLAPEQALNVVAIWDRRFSKECYALRAAGQNFSGSDAQVIIERVRDTIDPVEVVKGEAVKRGVDYLVERWFSDLGTAVDFFRSTAVAGLSIYFVPSETASDLDELVQLNRRVHAELAYVIFDDDLRSDWKSVLAAKIESLDDLPRITSGRPRLP